MSSVCSNCGGSEIDIDHTRGDAVCMNCGSVLEDNIIVSEVQFQENSIGGTSAIGQFVSAEGNKTGISLGAGFRHGLGQESRAVTLENGRKRITSLGHQLQMNQHCIDTAYNFYKLAVNKRLTRGRRTNHVVAACLYLVCRTEKTSHMLLDFSDILQIDVFTLGRAYLKLAQELYIHLPAVDPCLYIQRFAHKLEFAEKEHDVAMTALRLVSRMKRDWIHHGRRPSGLCGAAILVAARLHGFCRTVKQVVKVVRISDTTIRKRLGEFMDTPSSQLTIDEFQKIDLEEEQDPPCFTQARKRAKQQSEELNKPEIAKELETFRELMDAMLGIANIQEKENCLSDKADQQKTDPRTSCGSNENILVTQWTTTHPSEITSLPQTTSSASPLTNTTAERVDAKDCFQTAEDETGELDLAGLDDGELDKCLLTDKEVEIKTKIWMEENRDYLEKLKEKEEKEAKEREEGTKQEPKKRRKYNKKKQQGPASTAGEAIEKMLVEKKISSKINYEVLRGLETSQLSDRKSEPEVPLTSTPAPVAHQVANQVPEFRVPAVPTRRGGKKREVAPSPVPSVPAKKPKVQATPLVAKDVPRVSHMVVVESGPVEYEKASEETGTRLSAAGEEEEDEEFFDDDEMEEEPVSAAQLMGIDNEGLEDDYEDFEDDY